MKKIERPKLSSVRPPNTRPSHARWCRAIARPRREFNGSSYGRARSKKKFHFYLKEFKTYERNPFSLTKIFKFTFYILEFINKNPFKY